MGIVLNSFGVFLFAEPFMLPTNSTKIGDHFKCEIVFVVQRFFVTESTSYQNVKETQRQLAQIEVIVQHIELSGISETSYVRA